MKVLAVVIILWIVPTQGLAQLCLDTIVATFNEQRYQVVKTGVVVDRNRDLMWAVCSLGQQWEKGACVGEIQVLPWQAALEAANEWQFAGYSDWRLPSVYELSGITELRCQQPAINLRFFPNTPAADYWTATDFANDGAKSWRVHFGFGENHTDKKSTPAAVRLVRSIK